MFRWKNPLQLEKSVDWDLTLMKEMFLVFTEKGDYMYRYKSKFETFWTYSNHEETNTN